MSGKNLNTRSTLLRRVKDQYDQDAWEDFVKYYEQYIYNISRSIGLNDGDANDVTQQVLLKLWKNLPEFKFDETKGKFRTWLYHITVNTIKDLFRTQKTKSKHESNYLEEKLHLNGHITESEEQEFIDHEWKEYIYSLVIKKVKQEFNPSIFNCFKLLSEGMKPEEICIQLDIRQNTVYVYKKRVLSRIQSYFQELDEFLS